MSEVPKYWSEFRSLTESYVERANEIVEIEESRRLKEYNSLPWHKKLIYKHGTPNSFRWNVSLVNYGIDNFPKYTKLSLEEYYNWLEDTGRA